MEIGPLKERLKALEEENKKLTEQESALEHQARIQQQEEEPQSLVDVPSEKSQLGKQNSILETKYNQINAEIGTTRINMQRMEAQLKQISANLEEAHRWFKSKFDNLQRELARSREQKGSVDHHEEEEEEEKPVRLPSQACLQRWETKNQLKFISKKYLNELNKL
ncbi:hypothetical protein JRQ81_001453 [Phrynocephalus forsythii]|uniref:Uncharacterized protein n=1 Tax=Phrynocephalus forsythii TaxID=171643 RepID=A0A9Q0Y7Z7_9SAUR|nr:hypothetical protein JRQ81_001453 [Phrynocephalus forsythii]